MNNLHYIILYKHPCLRSDYGHINQMIIKSLMHHVWREHVCYRHVYAWNMHAICMKECMGRAGIMHEICKINPWFTTGNCMEHAWNMHETCNEHAWNMQRTCMKHATNLHETCIEPAWNTPASYIFMHEEYLEYECLANHACTCYMHVPCMCLTGNWSQFLACYMHVACFMHG